MTSNLKAKLFDFKNSLNIDQHDVWSVVEAHANFCDQYSELEVYNSLQTRLAPFTYYGEVKSLLENLGSTFNSDQLLYELKDAYRKIERKNGSHIYNLPLNALLGAINAGDATMRMEKIVSELALYDWVDEIKGIMWKVTTNPLQKQNYTANGGRVTPVHTITKAVNEGHLAYIENRWFHVTKEAISVTLLEKHIEDQEELRKMRLLEQAVNKASIDDKRIEFVLSEDLTLGLSVKNPGKLFINESEAESETTLETLFQSPLVSYAHRGFYPVIGEALQSIDKFVHLDVVHRVSNVLRPHLEAYAFNYGTGNYLYRVDKRMGSSLLKYESASTLIEDVMKEFDFDLTSLYKDKVSKDAKTKNALENAEKVVTEQLNEVNDGLGILLAESMVADMPEIVAERERLLAVKATLESQIQDIHVARHDMLNKEYANVPSVAAAAPAVVAEPAAEVVAESASDAPVRAKRSTTRTLKESYGQPTGRVPLATDLSEIAQELYSAMLANPQVGIELDAARQSGEVDDVVDFIIGLGDPQDQAARSGAERAIQSKIFLAMHQAGFEHYDDFANYDAQGEGTLYSYLEEIIYDVIG